MIYKNIIRRFFFQFDPESIHGFSVGFIKTIFKFPGIRRIVKSMFNVSHPSLERRVFGLKFSNPVGMAAGFDKNASFYNELASFGFSFIEIGTVTPLEQSGNPRPRSFRLPMDIALINRMGMNNPGAKRVAQNLRKNNPEVIIGGNIGKNTFTPNDKAINDYEICFEVLHEVVDYFVINVSCPNIGDIKRLQEADVLTGILKSLKKLSDLKSVKKPILLKISPDLNTEQLDELVEIALDTGIDGFVATNTTILREDLKTSENKVLEIGNGGLSGTPLKKRSTEIIRYLVKKSGGRIPVIGVGGIMDPADALEKLEAGASLIQIYTGFIYEGPGFVKRINKSLIDSKKHVNCN